MPGTVGGIAIGGFLSGLSVASDRGAWARFAVFALDASVIAGVGSVIAMRFGIGYRAVLGVGPRFIRADKGSENRGGVIAQRYLRSADADYDAEKCAMLGTFG